MRVSTIVTLVTMSTMVPVLSMLTMVTALIILTMSTLLPLLTVVTLLSLLTMVTVLAVLTALNIVTLLTTLCCRHVTHRVLQERNLEGQTLLAIIEVNRWVDPIQCDAITSPGWSICDEKHVFIVNINLHLNKFIFLVPLSSIYYVCTGVSLRQLYPAMV